jgi:GNAT superfamily N-acetyltransferase
VAAERLRLYPAGCWAAALPPRGASADGLVGYALSHPAVFGQPPALGSLLERIAPVCDCLYLHDLALLAPWRGTGLGTALIVRLLALARRHGFTAVTLTAVNDSRDFWDRLGFRAIAGSALRSKLASYGPDAVYMALDITDAG